METLEIRALTYNDLPPVGPVMGTISGSGGTIGRGLDNVISLPDPMRLVSRQHVQFTLDSSGLFRVSNISSENTAYVNDEELLRGESRVLRHHDILVVGGYVLRVSYPGQGQGQRNAEPAPPSPPPAAVVPPQGRPAGGDFLSELLGPSTIAKIRSESPSVPVPAGADMGLGAGRGSGAGAGLPPGMVDPFALGRMKGPGESDPVKILNERGINPGSLDNKGDDLINGEYTQQMASDLFHDPLTNPDKRLSSNSGNDPLGRFDEAGSGMFDDILRGGGTDASVDVARMAIDHGLEIEGLIHLPDLQPATPTRTAPPQVAAEPPPQITAGATPSNELDTIDQLLSGLDEISRPLFESPLPEQSQQQPEPPQRNDATTVLSHVEDFGGVTQFLQALTFNTVEKKPDASPPQQKAEPITQRKVEPIPQRKVEPIPQQKAEPITQRKAEPIPQQRKAEPLPQQKTTPVPTSQPAEDELYKAFIEGLGVALPGREALDKNFMRMIGQLLRGYSQGALELLSNRTVVRRAVRVDVTMIAPERNNPLKFSPDVIVALGHLLGKNSHPGFMGSVEAVNNAFTDLRAHELGLISGMKSAFNYVMESLDPNLVDDGGSSFGGLFDGILSMRRRAQLWDAYGKYFQETKEGIADNFDAFFANAFRSAYEAAIEELQSGGGMGR
jgi:type VI secretion system FHA domain protein